MAAPEYHFVTTWRVRGTLEEVGAVFTNGPDLTRWWPAVYLDVRELEPGDTTGVGTTIGMYTKGWLPYTLRWQFRVSEVRQDGFTLDASGDFVGRGIWTFAQEGPNVIITYDWKIRAVKPLLRYLSFILRPIFAANHQWAMAKGEQSLNLELERRRAKTPEERARIAPPPAPTSTSAVPLLAGSALLVVVTYAAARRLRGR